ncbi:MAG: glutaredoxin family protein [Gammaproteobacteria bacterium]
MKTLFRLLRWPLGQIIIILDWISGPKPPTRSAETQQKLDAQTTHLKLYQFHQCPFCVRTRRSIRGLGLNIETRDTRNDPRWQSELIEQGGRYQVPCLRIDKGDDNIEWLYESKDIIRYLDQRFANGPP